MEERGRLARPRLELGVVLAAHVIPVPRELEDLHALALDVLPHELQARLVELAHVLRVDLVPAAPLCVRVRVCRCSCVFVSVQLSCVWSGGIGTSARREGGGAARARARAAGAR